MFSKSTRSLLTTLALALGVALPLRAVAHCDSLDGPVVTEARAALEAGEVTPVLKWVAAEDEKEIRHAFEQTLVVRTKGDTARELADRFFLETLVRVHRASEGEPFTGLKPAGLHEDHAVELADTALAEGSVDTLVTELTEQVRRGVQHRFEETMAARKAADTSVDAGREYVKQYVEFIHYAKGLGMAAEGASHHAPAAAEASACAPACSAHIEGE